MPPHVTERSDLRYQPEWLEKRLPGLGTGARSGRSKGRWRELDESDLHPADLEALNLMRAVGAHNEYVMSDDTISITHKDSKHERNATIGYSGPGMVHFFTDSWKPFREGRTYSTDEIRALLNGQEPKGAKREPQAAADKEPVSRFFDAKGRFIVAAAGELLRAEGHLCMGHDGLIYRWDHGVYVNDGDQWARERLRTYLGETWRRSYADETLAWLRAWPIFITAVPSREYLNVRNGFLRLADLTLHSHSPAIASAIQLAAEWHPDAVCPVWEKFFSEVLPGIPRSFLYELIGYTLYPANPHSKAVMALGAGENGKSVMLAGLRALLGSRNYSSVPLQELAENRFKAAQLFGKLANICGDIDARAIKRTDLFKQITGGDSISAEHKYGQPFEFTAFATPWFSANEPPLTSDQTDAWFRRWIILPFTVTFAKDRADPFIRDRLSTPAELDGLVVQAVHGLRRLIARGYFDAPDSVDAAGDRYRDWLDTVRGYVAEECVIRDDTWVPVPRAELYRSYRSWCLEGGRIALSAATFNERLQRDYPQIALSVVRGVRRWVRIGKRSDLDGAL